MAAICENKNTRRGGPKCPPRADTRVGPYVQRCPQGLQLSRLGARIAGTVNHEPRDLERRQVAAVEVLARPRLVHDAKPRARMHLEELRSRLCRHPFEKRARGWLVLEVVRRLDDGARDRSGAARPTSNAMIAPSLWPHRIGRSSASASITARVSSAAR